MKVQAALITILVLAAGVAVAQNAPPQERHAPPMGMMRPGGPQIGFAFEMMEMREQIKGAPYTATAVTESTQVLSDGNRIVNKRSGLVARDSEGRIRREETMGRIGGLQVGGPNMIMIHDPVAKTATMLDPDSKTARVMNARGMRGLHRKMEFMKKGGEPQHPEMGQIKKESLGTQQIEGVNAEGTRITRTIPAGAVGNEKPIDITVETWTSTDLHVLVLSKRSDPRFGETIFRLTNIKRAEPDPTLFQVPSDFKTVQGMPEPMRMRRPGPPPASPQQN
jgi:hypothetical protein